MGIHLAVNGSLTSIDIEQNEISIDASTNIVEIELTNNEYVIETSGLFSLIAGDYIPTNQKGSANGVATLDANGLIPSSQIPSSGTAATVADIDEAIESLNAVTVGNIYW